MNMHSPIGQESMAINLHGENTVVPSNLQNYLGLLSAYLHYFSAADIPWYKLIYFNRKQVHVFV